MALKNKHCTAASPITLTNTLESWMPAPGHWPTLSYLPLYPRIISAGSGDKSAAFNIGTDGNGITYIHIRGIAFVSRNATGIISPIIEVDPLWVWYSRNNLTHEGDPAYMPDHITFDRNIIMHDYAPYDVAGGGTINAVQWNGVNGVFEDNYFSHIYNNSNNGSTCIGESYAHYSGSLLVRHNYCSDGTGQGFMFGDGNRPPFPTYQNNHTFEYNHIYKSLRYIRTHPWYNGLDTSWKNCFETKNAQNYIIRYNQCDNSWQLHAGSQWYGVTITPRTNPGRYTAYPVDLQNGANGPTSRVHLGGGWGGFRGLNPTALFPGMWIGISKADVTGADCAPWNSRNCEWHKIVAVDNENAWADVDAPFTSAVATSGLGWWYAYGDASGSNGQIYGNFFRNNPTMTELWGSDDIGGGGTLMMGSEAKNIVVRNNIGYANSPYIADTWGWTHWGKMHAGMNWSVDHNTYYRPGVTQYNTGDYANTLGLNDIDNVRVSENLVSGAGGGFNCSSQQLGTIGHIDGVRRCTADSPNVVWAYNIFNHYSGAVNDTTQNGSRNLSHNTTTPGDDPGYVDASKNLFMLSRSSPYRYTGRNGHSAGADPERVAMIRNLNVSATDKTALVSWEVTEPIYTWDAQLDCSTDDTLHSETGYYSAIPDLNPTFFKRADEGASNPRYTQGPRGRYRWWQLGDLGSLTGDDEQIHSLTLTPATRYYCRLSVGGAVERFSFRTQATPPSTQLPLVIHITPHTGTTVRFCYGSQIGSSECGIPTPCTSGCSVTLGVIAGKQLVYHIEELDASGNVVASSSAPTVLLIGGTPTDVAPTGDTAP